MTRNGSRRAELSDRPARRPAARADGATGDDLHQALWHFRTQFAKAQDATPILRAAVKMTSERFQASAACLAVIRTGSDVAQLELTQPTAAEWDVELLGNLLRGRQSKVPGDLMFCRIRRRGRIWGGLVLQRWPREFDWSERKALSLIGELVNELTARVDEERIRQVRMQVDRKLLEQVQPKHLFYKILHGIRSLAEYDHSAALLLYDPSEAALEIVAEQISIQKAKSLNVGLKLPVDAELHQQLVRHPVFGFDRRDSGWIEWTETSTPRLAELLDYNPRAASDRFPMAEKALLCVPLLTRTGLLGLLKVAAVHPGSLGSYEAELLSQFLPQAAVALQNLRRTERLEQQVLLSERKHAMADLARGVAHDVNNALGTTLPLLQQLLEDLQHGTFDPQIAYEDLVEMERSLQLCRRVFGGMLSFARSAHRNRSEVSLFQAVDCALAVLRRTFQVQRIELAVDVSPELPFLSGVHADIEQLVLNLVCNARDAMPDGGTLTIAARQENGGIELLVRDTGTGIPADVLRRIQEPFFTTKPTGTGLGLAICRAIVAQMRGRLSIESQPGRGTTVRILLPLPE